MASSQNTIRIGYVPEHYLTPLHLALRLNAASDSPLPFKISLIPFPSGTGHMITSLRANEIDIGIGLTEGWVAGLVGKAQLEKPGENGGYRIVGEWVDSPLRWAIVTGRERGEIKGVGDLKGGRVGVSRLGSGSHIMSFVLAQDQNWPADTTITNPLTPVILGPFPSLRDEVSGPSPTADFFMWEQFTTKPSFHPTPSNPSPPLKKIGEIFTPWPSWFIAASTATFPTPAEDERLASLFKVLDRGIEAFEADRAEAVRLLGTGELGCTYVEDDAKEWLKDVRFVKGGVRGVNGEVIREVVSLLKVAGVVPAGIGEEEAMNRVVGIFKGQGVGE